MSQSTDETIQPTQSVEVVMETETQDELPETQQSVCNYDIFYHDDCTDSDEDICGMEECTGCSSTRKGVEQPKKRLCASCLYYERYG
jgi:hypothetical protein